MKQIKYIAPTVVALMGLSLPGYSDVLLNDTFADGSRAQQNLPTESQWFGSPGAGLTTTVGHLLGAPAAASSASWTTYFTDSFASSVNLANEGDTLSITWVFTLTGINAQNNSQGFHMGILQSPNGGRVATDATPANQVYAGYGSFWNMGATLGRGNNDNFDLMEWAVPGGANNILSTTAAYTKIGAGDGALNGTGFAESTQYTFTFTAQRVATGLQLDQTIVGGSLNGTGGMTNSFLDTTVSSYTFDTFALRPTAGSVAATGFDTTLFNVQFTTAVPEPSTIVVAGLAALGLVASYRRMRR